jgi:membrane AbrB-like protein
LKSPSRAGPVAKALALCIASGALFALLHIPLAWMLGSMIAMAAARMSGAQVEQLAWGRAAGMVVVGVSLGLYFTAPVIHEVSTFWPWFVLLGVLAIAAGTVSAFVLARLSGVDAATAYFGSMPGGASEMSIMGETYGAAVHSVAFAHSVRVLFVVTLFPIAITAGGFHASDDYRPVVTPFDGFGLALLLTMGAGAGLLARMLRAPTAFMMGPLFATIAVTALGYRISSMPTALVNAAQVLLGCAMGARFERSFLREAPRFVMALIPSVLTMVVLAVLIGLVLSYGSGVYIGAGLLVAAPGGIAEMSLTAKVLRIGVAFVTAGHVMRYLMVVILTVPIFRLYTRITRARSPRETPGGAPDGSAAPRRP